MGKHRDWTEIRDDYQTSGLSYAALSEKYSVPIDTLKKAAARQGWTKRKEKRQAAAERVAVKMAQVTKGTEETAPLKNGTEEMAPAPTRAAQIEQYERIIAKMLEKLEKSVEYVAPESTQAVKQLTGALRDLQGLLRLGKDELDMEEQKARIEKLRAEAESGGPPEPVVVRFVNREWTDADA